MAVLSVERKPCRAVLWDGSPAAMADIQTLWPDATATGSELILPGLAGPVTPGVYVLLSPSGQDWPVVWSVADFGAEWEVE